MDFELQKELWADFIYDGKLDSRVRPEIAESWLKCRQHGVNPAGGKGKHADGTVFNSIYEANLPLIKTAMPVMQSIFDIVDHTHYLIVLTDSVGYLLETMGDTDIYAKSEDLRFEKGALWSSTEVGTNAISVALEFDKPTQMAGAEHYCRSHHEWTCSAAPIHGIDGEIIGCINLSGFADTVHSHTLALAIAAANSIESQIRLAHNAALLCSALEASNDAIFLVGSDYKPFWVNSAAKKFTGIDFDQLKTMDFRELLPNVQWNRGGHYFSDDTRIVLGDKVLYCGVDIGYLAHYGSSAFSITIKKQKHILNAVNRLSRNRACYCFEDFLTRDPDMLKTLALAKRYADYNGNILIEGETGTGKELIAQSIHNAGPYRDGPFVAVKCASFPREMLENELFGCESGVFGGKVMEGSPGRFELAQRGTLFLDEVSEMPLEFQAKLLGVVESHTVRRIGSTQDIELDIRIIASSSHPLEQLVRSGSFREDLYHMLNVLTLKVSPLRSRPGDIALCVGEILKRLNDNHPELKKTVSDGFMAGLVQYDWPGNVRQLQNSIERAFYSETGSVLSEESLSYVFLSSIRDKTVREADLAPGGRGQAAAITAALERCAGDVAAAAGQLGISRATLYRRLQKYNIDPKQIKKSH